ncbi:13456_t:CDS:2, partial [Gigaspora margarita]
QHGEDWKDLCLNDTIIRELTSKKCKIYQVHFDEIENEIVDVLAEEEEQTVTEPFSVPEALSDNSESSLEEEEEQNMDVIDLSILVNWQEQPVTIDQRAINLVYNHVCKVNVSSISLASLYELFRRFLPLNYIEQFVINSINIRGR